MITSKLSEILGRKRIKMAELSRKTGITKNTILNLYHDRTTRIEFEVLNKLCNVLECMPSDILHHEPDLDTKFLAAGRFVAPIPSMDEVLKVGEDEYVDVHGNKHDGSTIRACEAMGGNWEEVSGSLFKAKRGRPKKKDGDD